MTAPVRPALRGREHERQVLDTALDGVRDGQSAVLVIRGGAGVGKTALLRYCARQASGCRVVRIGGAESESELAFAALHQLCMPLLDDLASLPEPQQRALRAALGLVAGEPDRFVVGLAVLTLLAAAAAERPLVCLVDDAQWLDLPSAQVLGFLGRRLQAEPVLLAFAVREPAEPRLLQGLPTLTLEGLAEEDARALLMSAIPGHLDAQVRDRIVAETRGNPLALLELPARMSEAELAGGLAVAPTDAMSQHVQDHYLAKVRRLSGPTRRLLLLAAADPTGDATLLWRAAQALGLGGQAAALDHADPLLEIGPVVRFSHPLVRSAAYWAGSAQDRCEAHRALASATDPEVDPGRRLWHLAAAATEPDEDLAAELERVAAQDQARGGLPAAAAFLERSLALTAEPANRADRALAAARAHLHAGAFDPALALLAQAEAAAVDDLQRAQVDMLRARISHASSSARDAPVSLAETARRLERLDVRVARETYLDAWGAALFAGVLAHSGGDLLDISRRARAVLRPMGTARPCDLLLDALTAMIVEGRPAAAPGLRAAKDAFSDDQVSPEDRLRWGQLATTAAIAVGDLDAWVDLSRRQVDLARAAGALVPLALALDGRAVAATWCGDFEAATSLAAEQRAVRDVTGMRGTSYAALFLIAYQGRATEAAPQLAAAGTRATARGEGLAAQMATWATAVLHNGLGQYADALAAAEQADVEPHGQILTAWVLPELIEAAARGGDLPRARRALLRLSEVTAVANTDWAAGVEARSRGLLSVGADAERGFATALARLGRTQARPDLARAHLLFGEWLRRQGRRLEAREQLRAAYEVFAAIGADAFAERARRELLATGQKVRRRDVDTHNELTPQEEHIARLARDGHTNPEIGAELFISARTVEWHLRKVFTKLGITSRKDLPDALPTRARVTTPTEEQLLRG